MGLCIMTTMPDTTASSSLPDQPAWTPWTVARTSHFRVDDGTGTVCFCQVDKENFDVTTSFRFDGERVLAMLRKQLVQMGVDESTAAARVDDARTYRVERDNRTDFASIPKYLRWFENPYGRHTLAAIIHDRLITDEGPNKGALGSDTLSDRFFREMMGDCGVKPFKRWIMWAAVALRSRWAAGGWRRISVAVWLVLASLGIASFVTAVLGRHPFGVSTQALLVFAFVAPLVSCTLWGRQWGASLVAALAALWILPPTVLALVGYGVYVVLERITDQVSARRSAA